MEDDTFIRDSGIPARCCDSSRPLDAWTVILARAFEFSTYIQEAINTFATACQNDCPADNILSLAVEENLYSHKSQSEISNRENWWHGHVSYHRSTHPICKIGVGGLWLLPERSFTPQQRDFTVGGTMTTTVHI